MDLPRPTGGHHRLAVMTGAWAGHETIHPSPWQPEGLTATGRNDCRLDLDGFAVITDYAQQTSGGFAYRGHGVTTYDDESGLYSLHWFDSMGSPPEVFTGPLEGDVLTLVSRRPGRHSRLVYDFSHPGRWLARMEMSEDGHEWKVVFDGEYVRE